MAGPTLLDIYNMVLQSLGGEDKNAKLLDAVSDNTKGGRLVRLCWPQARRKTLAALNWPFAIERSELLEAEDTAPDFEFDYQFDLSAIADILRICSVHDANGLKATTRWEQEGDELLWDEDECFIRYITDIEDPAGYSPNFIEVAVLECAYMVAMPLTGEQKIKDAVFEKLHKVAIPAAKAACGMGKYVDNEDGSEDVADAGK